MSIKTLAHLTRLLAALGLLLMTGSLYAQSPAAEHAHRVFLPMVRTTGGTGGPGNPGGDPGNPDTGPYAELRARASQACPQLGLNQICYVGGPVTLQSGAGTSSFTMPGAIVDLSAGAQLILAAPTADSAGWGAVRMRLGAGVELDLLAFGNLELGLATLGDTAAALPELSLRTAPAPGSDGRYSSGLTVSGQAGDLGAVVVNGVTINLSGATYLSADQPAGVTPRTADDDLIVPLTVAVSAGAAQVTTAGGEQVAAQGQQVQVPADQSGQAAGPPSAATDVMIRDYLFNLIVPLDEVGRQRLADELIGRLETAIERCVAGRVRSIYNVLFWNRVIDGMPFLEERIGPARLSAAQALAANCLSFEIEFDSRTVTQGGPVIEQSHLRASRLPLSFNADGSLRIGGETDLAYQMHDYSAAGACPLSTVTLGGGLRVEAGSLRIAINQLRLDLLLAVSRPPGSAVFMHCPHATVQLSEDQWWQVFPHLHRSIWQPGQPHTFRFRDWRYTAGSAACTGGSPATCAHVGEAIYQLEETSGEITFSADTHLILVHAPQR